jgi:two-component system sensor histidine kinase CpxA
MRSLFLKIFLSYWIAQALFLMLAIVVTVAMYPSHEIAAIQAQQPRFLSEAVQAYQGAGEEGARKYLRAVHDGAHVRLFVFDAQGHDLLGRKPPDWIQKVVKGETRTADSFWGRLGPMQFLRESEILADGQRYTLVIELPPQQHTLFGPNGVPGLWVLIGIISSGLVCYVLARYLTSPIVRLRAATQKLAAGDLTARAGVSPSRRHDETAELVRDFDRMAERIESLLTAQGRLLTDISHELRSPLARLNVALELARQRSGPEAQSALERIDREATRLNGLIAELLTIARLEGSESLMPRSPIQLEQLIQEIARDGEFEAQDRNCHVEVSVVDDCVLIGNPALLHSAIENVVRNAVRYTGQDTEVEIRLEEGQGAVGSEAVIRVTDSGPGVPEDALDKIFQPFYRIDDARGRQTGGVGLGLAITERAVRLHGGTVKAANRPQGGLMVEIRLPLGPVKAANRVVQTMPANAPVCMDVPPR